MKTRQINAGGVLIGGGARISVQSMTNIPSHNYTALLAQIKALSEAGCDIIRLAVPDYEAVCILGKIKDNIDIPLVADIHYDYRLALESAAAGADKIRINPGNIGSPDRVKAVADACRIRSIPIRIGVNGGSLEKELLAKYGGPVPEALVESALNQAHLLESFDFRDICLSLKTSGVSSMIKAYRLASEVCDYPLHLGVTEAGGERIGTIKSAIGIGSLLSDGIGDTIRVSLSADPIKEVTAGKDILRAMELTDTINIVSCPTCGRCKVDVISVSEALSQRLKDIVLPEGRKMSVAIMGCAVNGPGEAREADLGIAGGDGEWLFFKKGEIIGKIRNEEVIDRLVSEIKSLI